VFQGTPHLKLNLAGGACTVNPTTGCTDAATDPIVQSSIQLEQDKTSNELQGFKYYPVSSVVFSWKF
jgi:hypothetical protein